MRARVEDVPIVPAYPNQHTGHLEVDLMLHQPEACHAHARMLHLLIVHRQRRHYSGSTMLVCDSGVRVVRAWRHEPLLGKFTIRSAVP